MKTLLYNIDIQAPVSKVFDTMLNRDTYKQWTSEFNPTSDFKGGWNKGDKIYFTSTNETGKCEGMIAQIAEHIPNEYISIRHYGILDNDIEITEGPAVAGWAGALENYTFKENGGITTVDIAVDTNDEYVAYFDKTWPKALKRLKEICE
ncbi:SRPBCC domain-containing protein [Sphingobacterium olei]|uniref:SRPBCC domain-containing protein n=1 Tax=Sphingobacterium olei TaxID=2571155 RepID=A0A4U0NCP5_9SPHI|nr:SRPBCC domain-containing protein [Sphingobacterium olei]TJZ51787.1 SRPBCC domain-containing protein [Sphingobacterium olei]